MKALDELRELANDPLLKWVADLKRGCALAALAMKDIHGGEWNVHIDHENHLILIGMQIEQ